MTVRHRCRCCGSPVRGGKTTFVCSVCRPTSRRHLDNTVHKIDDIDERIEYYAALAELRLPLFDHSPYVTERDAG